MDFNAFSQEIFTGIQQVFSTSVLKRKKIKFKGIKNPQESTLKEINKNGLSVFHGEYWDVRMTKTDRAFALVGYRHEH